MKHVLQGSYVLATVLIVAVLEGCSGGGAGGPVSTASRPAPAQVASALLIQQWGQTLWGMVSAQTGTQPPSFGEPVFNPDGSITQILQGADGTRTILSTFPDGTARLNITYPNGSTQTVDQSKPALDGVSKTTTKWRVTSSDGLSVTYTTVIDNRGTPFDMSDDTVALSGVSTLPGNLSQSFSAMTEDGQTALQSTQSDGSTFTMNVPLVGPDFVYPDFSRATSGTYGDGGVNIAFTLAATGEVHTRWNSISSNVGGGMEGRFSLNADFSGSGELRQGQELVATLNWSRTGESQISFVSADSLANSPAGAAADYLTHRWQTLTALYAPAPGLMSALGHEIRSVVTR